LNSKLVEITGTFSASIHENKYKSYPYQGDITGITEIDYYDRGYSIIKQKQDVGKP